jgi:hypothetical protein
VRMWSSVPEEDVGSAVGEFTYTEGTK